MRKDTTIKYKNSQQMLIINDFNHVCSILTLISVIFAQSTQMCGRDFQKRSNIFERKEVKKVGMPIDKVFISLLWRLDI